MWSYIESFADQNRSRDRSGNNTRDPSGNNTRDRSGNNTRDASGNNTRDASGNNTRDASGNNTRDASGNNTRDASGNRSDPSGNYGDYDGPTNFSLSELVDLLRQSQKMEENLYSILIKNAENVAQGRTNQLTQAEKDEIVAQINQFSAYRTSLYQLIWTNYRSQIISENAASDTSAIQLKTLELLEKEMNKSKKNMTKLKDEHLNAMKMVEINTYYSKQYLQYQKFMKTIVVIVLLLIVSTLIRNRLSETVGNGLFAAVVSVGFLVMLYQIIDIYRRSMTNYDTYTWPLAPTSAATLESSNDSVVDVSGALVTSMPDVCAGAYCCGTGTVWSDTSGCVLSEDYQI
jgi:hypothetical protein